MKKNPSNGMVLIGDARGRVSFMSPNSSDPLV